MFVLAICAAVLANLASASASRSSSRFNVKIEVATSCRSVEASNWKIAVDTYFEHLRQLWKTGAAGHCTGASATPLSWDALMLGRVSGSITITNLFGTVETMLARQIRITSIETTADSVEVSLTVNAPAQAGFLQVAMALDLLTSGCQCKQQQLARYLPACDNAMLRNIESENDATWTFSSYASGQEEASVGDASFTTEDMIPSHLLDTSGQTETGSLPPRRGVPLLDDEYEDSLAQLSRADLSKMDDFLGQEAPPAETWDTESMPSRLDVSRRQRQSDVTAPLSRLDIPSGSTGWKTQALQLGYSGSSFGDFE
ncbi:MAG: hypothetical protein MHM6MM_002380 [Cercozoa sp. M6MM]